jgi:hypothetical protein
MHNDIGCNLIDACDDLAIGEWSLVQAEGEVDALGVVVATNIFDG